MRQDNLRAGGPPHTTNEDTDLGFAPLTPNQAEALSYMREMLPALSQIATSAELPFIAYLIEMAVEETESRISNTGSRIAKTAIRSA